MTNDKTLLSFGKNLSFLECLPHLMGPRLAANWIFQTEVRKKIFQTEVRKKRLTQSETAMSKQVIHVCKL